MARTRKKYFYRKRKSEVYVYYIDTKTGKQTFLPRKETKHLDPLTDDEVDQWVQNWAANKGIELAVTKKRVLLSTDPLYQQWEAFRKEYRLLRNIKSKTDYAANELFHDHIVKYFVEEHRKKDVKAWAPLIPGFTIHLKKKDIKIETIKKILWLLRRFSEYLFAHGEIETIWAPRIPSRNRRAVTPLQLEMSPEKIDILVHKLLTQKFELQALAVLLGYYASLRPSESYALTKEDFLTGKTAVDVSKTYARFQKYSLGSKLAIKVSKALVTNDPKEQVKTIGSSDIVTVWSADGAKKIAAIIKDKPEGRLFPHTRWHLDKLFRDALKAIEYSHIKPHDLRRSSALYLGRERGIEMLLLQEHMRHAEISTTMLYVRRPIDNIKQVDKQDFDDVG